MKLAARANIAALLAAIAVVSLAGVFAAFRLTAPGDGARLMPGQDVWRPDGIVVTPLEYQPGGLRGGDRVVAVDGHSLETWARALFTGEVPRPQWQIGETVTYTVLREGKRLDVPVVLKVYPVASAVIQNAGNFLFLFALQLIATFVFVRRPADRAARAFFVFAWSIWHSPIWLSGLQVSDYVGRTGFWLYKAITFPPYLLTFTALVHFALVFPTTHPIAAKRPWLIPAQYAAAYVLYAVYLLAVWPMSVSTLQWLGRWAPGEWLITLIYLTLTIVFSIGNFRASRNPVVRQKARWAMSGLVMMSTGVLFLWLLPGATLGHPLISPSLVGWLALPLPLAFAIAILRHQLFDIDLIVNRALVYSALTGITMGIYILIVGALGDLLQTRDRTIVAFLATGLVAVIFQPLRERLQRAVNRLMYGERDEPYVVLSRLGQRLESTLAPDSVLPTIVETVGQTLKLPYTAITLRDTDTVAAAYGPPSPHTIAFPLGYQHELIGHLLVAQRSPDESFTPAEQRLLEDIARQAGVAAHAVRLTADLQRARERLVTAREEERRRLRRNLHDGLGPALAAQTLKVGSARALFNRDPAAADALLADLERDIDFSLADIRRLVYDLRPPALDELGLVGAIRESATQYDLVDGLRLAMDVPAQLPPLPAAVEVAAYRIAQEALTNVVRHARARHGSIRLTIDDGLRLEICDDGVGLPPEHRFGVGLTSMHERAEELGGTCVLERRPEGGMRVVARLPIASDK